jgi:putative protein-disulfide isomerase
MGFKKILLLLFILNIAFAQKKNMKSTILYIYDPLCGWCYGFTPVIQQIQKKYSEKFDFEIISGGMVVGANEGAITQIAPYISQAYKRVEEYSGIKFGEAFLNKRLWDSTYRMSSLPPSIALEVFKNMSHNNSIDFAHDVQHAFYFEGKSLNDIQTYLELIKPYSLDPVEFQKMFESEQFKQQTIENFKKSSKLGVNGFPTVIYIHANEKKVLTRGFTSVSDLDKILTKL